MKKIAISLILLLNLVSGASMLDESIRLYPKPADSLFMSALAALSNSNYEISEMQSKNGYILFKDKNEFYLLTVTKRYQSQSEIKILPQNSDFSKGSEVAKSIFTLIDNELKNPPELVK